MQRARKISLWIRGGKNTFKRWGICFCFFSGYSHSNSIFTTPFLFILCPLPIPFSLLLMPPMLPHAVLVPLRIIFHHIVFLSHTYCFKPISQIGSRGPIAHLGVSRQGPKLEAVKSEGRGQGLQTYFSSVLLGWKQPLGLTERSLERVVLCQL